MDEFMSVMVEITLPEASRWDKGGVAAQGVLPTIQKVPPRAHHSAGVDARSRGGFSLVLSLTVMAMLVLTVVTITAFISIEARLMVQHQLGTRARLNALASLRLAVGQLQQEAGPDRRATARADLTQPGVAVSALKNPMWTGVWRSDRPDQPPAWLVSGRADRDAGSQSASLSGESDYTSGHWAPWQTDYAPGEAEVVKLVGLGSATAHETVTPVPGDPFNYDRPSGLVYLPPIRMPDLDTGGRYAYWVGDEGVKARINLQETRSVGLANTLGNLAALRSPVRAAFELLPGLGALATPAELAGLSSVCGLPNLSGFINASPTATTTDLNARRLFHEVSLTSSGVLADSLHGGLKRDLSLVFELNDNDFARTEFGSGFAGAAATLNEVGMAALTMGLPHNGDIIQAAPLFNRVAPEGNVRGPTWWSLRSFYRLHKELGWSGVKVQASAGDAAGWNTAAAPALRARTFYPNVQRLHPTPGAGNDNSIRRRLYTYSDVFNGDQTSPLNPNVVDTGTIFDVSYRPVPRPVAVAATPYVHRVSAVFGVTRSEVKSKGKNVPVLNLSVVPVVVLHNPFNVAITSDSPDRGNADKYSMALSFSDMDQWTLRFSRTGHATRSGTYELPLSDFFSGADADANTNDLIRAYLPTTFTLQPGEFRAFSSSAETPNGRVLIMAEGLNPLNGLQLPDSLSNAWGPAGMDITAAESFSFAVIPYGSFRVRQALACWPGDQLKKNAFNTTALYHKSSEHAELFYRNLNPDSDDPPGGVPSTSYGSLPWRADPLTGVAGTPLPITVVDISARTANWVSSPFPVFTHSNPMAATVRADGAGRTAPGGNNGFLGAPPSFRVGYRRPGGWNDIVPLNGASAYGGFALDATGSTRAVHLEIPLVPSTSLAQLGDAAFGLRDQQPAYGIGAGFASLLIDSRRSFQDNGPNWTEFDQTYLLNAGLWDAFYLSGAGPVMARAAEPYAPLDPDIVRPPSNNSPGANPPYVETRPLSSPAAPDDDVLDDFMAGLRTLGNPRLRLSESSQTAENARLALGDHRRSAAVLMNDGAFNVNSTSVEAWAALLGSAKKMALTQLQPGQPSSNADARFPRSLPHGTTALAQDAMNATSNWQGVAALTDAQIYKLAAAIVAENKARATLSFRNERDAVHAPAARLFAGRSAPATPYLGLSEFVNRFLCTDAWAGRCGALQAAIFRADADHAAGLSDRLSAGGLGQLTQASLDHLANPNASFASDPENGVIVRGSNRTHTALGAPGNLLQNDVLKVIGPALASRSDTFVVRAYGDATDASGAVARGLLEAVVQRMPEFVDDADPPESGCAAPKPSALVIPAENQTGEPSLRTGLTQANRTFGRKFKTISIRWIRPDEA